MQSRRSRARRRLRPAKPAPPAFAQGNTALGLFTATTFLSAFLLFAIQPLFAKMVLPVLGGSPSVWAVALCFFQAALLTGYCYAYLLMRLVPVVWTGSVHICVALLALFVLPIGLPEGWTEPPPGEPYLWQLGLFTLAVGLPFVAVAANAPLLQAWFARTGHPHARDPYFLYAASNLGSLIALLSYPFVLEPEFGVTALSRYWAFLFICLAVSLAVCSSIMRKSVVRGDEPAAPSKAVSGEFVLKVPTRRDRLGWIGLAFVPAALLTAFTTHLATDIASAPLLWVLPLALYLLTFVLAFRDTFIVPMRLLLAAHLIAVAFALLELSQVKNETWTLTSAAGVTVFFISGLVAHRTLYNMRPRALNLTEFYLWMAFGGVLGGLFAALIAPKLFSEVFEYPLLIALTMACRPGVFARRDWTWRELIWLGGMFAVGLTLVLFGTEWAADLGLWFGEWGIASALTLLFAVVMLAFWIYPARQFVAALLMFAAVVMLPSAVRRANAERSYFGVYRVTQSEEGDYNILQHGTTLHGSQRIRNEDGELIADTTPGTYYYPGSPIEKSIRIVQDTLHVTGEEGRIGIVGLGTGSLACYSKKGERWRFYEIDPVVVDIAQKSNHFTFLVNCRPKADIVVGDGRITIAKEPDSSFDLLLVDAFSSDAVPVHLMTAEALRLYARKLKGSGVLVLHISNRYLDLDPVLEATMPLVPELKGLIISDPAQGGTYAQLSSTIAVFAKDTFALDPFRAVPGAQDFKKGGLDPWTDDSSDILGPFLSRWRGG
ncbi:MAG: fused MFS/spermidine synthase [Hyphomicrobiaceae bacterium]|nr:fused MFS/spermidine synthase [Hyphomicrobiaceae bacterium]